MSKRIASIRMYVSALFALFGAMATGCVIIWSGTALASLKKPGSVPQIRTCKNGTTVTTLEEDAPYESWIINSITLGAVSGSLFAAFIIRFIGRRKTLICTGIPNLIGWACICYARNFVLIIIGRFTTGFYAGIICNALPVYVIDIATPNRRGFFGAAFHIMICFGLFYQVCFGSLLEWNHLSYVSVVPGLICSFGMFFFSIESPIRLMESGDGDEARNALAILRDKKSDIDEELAELEQRIRSRLHGNALAFANLKRADVYRPVIISVILMTFQQFSGINTFWFNLMNIFDLSINSNIASIILSAALVCATVHSAFVMDRLGRKMLLILSGIGQVVALSAMGYYYKVIHPDSSWIPVACLILFVVMYSLGFGPIPWLIPGEMTPRQEIPLVSCLVSVTNWGLAFVIIKYSDVLTAQLHRWGTYWLFAGCSALSVVYTIIFVPETKGRSTEELQKYFLQNARNS